MKSQDLQCHIHTLVNLPETKSPMLSVYADLTEGADTPARLLERMRQVTSTLDPTTNADLQAAFGRVQGHLERTTNPRSQGMALFIREGESPFLLALEFEVRVPTELSVDTVPSIFRLVELKDTYDQYVVMISNEREARILEVSLGAVTQQLWAERPELRRRVGREWTKQHYRNHRENRTEHFVKEKIDILDRVMQKGQHSHLILAGQPTMTSRIERALPPHLKDRLIDLVRVSTRTSARDVVQATLASFVEEEARQSLSMVELLERELHSNSDMVAVGSDATREALLLGQVDVLLIAADYEKQHGDREEKEDFARLAEQSGCTVEVVPDSQSLAKLGGVGSLLRYPAIKDAELTAPTPG